MATYNTYSSGPAFTRLDFGISSNQDKLTAYPNDGNIEYRGDLLFAPLVSTRCSVRSPWLPVAHLLGLPRNVVKPGANTPLPIEKPVDRSWSWFDDQAEYGNQFTAPHLLYEEIKGVTQKEHGTSHLRANGFIEDVGDEGTGLTVVSTRLNMFAGNYVDPNRHPDIPVWTYTSAFRPLYRKTGVSDAGYLVFEDTADSWLGYPTKGFLYDDVVRINAAYLKQAGTWSYTRGVHTFTYSNFVDRNDYDNGVYDMEYDFRAKVTSGSNYYYADFHVHLHFWFAYQPVWGTATASDWNRPKNGCFDVVNRSTVKAISDVIYSWLPNRHPPVIKEPFRITPVDVSLAARIVSPYGPTDLTETNLKRFLHGPWPEGVTSRTEGDTFFWDSSHVEGLRRVFNRNLKEFRPASFISSSEALRPYFEVIKANHLENLKEVKDIFDAIPDIRPLMQILVRVMRGDRQAIVQLIDYVTDAILRYKFAQRPLVQDGKELILNNGEIARKTTLLLHKREPKTLYGSLTYVFSEDEMMAIGVRDGALSLEVHSKIRISYDLSSAMIGFILSNSLGVAPTLERLWNTLPLSFVVDWLFNMSERLKQVDTAALWCVVDFLYGVHSYKLKWYPSPELLAPYGLGTSSEQPFYLSVYRRDLTFFAPRLATSRFDFVGDNPPPDSLTVGSLLWQVLS